MDQNSGHSISKGSILKKILIVEDHKKTVEFFKIALEKENLTVTTKYNGSNAITKIHETFPDLFDRPGLRYTASLYALNIPLSVRRTEKEGGGNKKSCLL
jgi:hypothetical protein